MSIIALRQVIAKFRHKIDTVNAYNGQNNENIIFVRNSTEYDQKLCKVQKALPIRYVMHPSPGR